MRAALRWMQESGQTELGLRLAGALRWYWQLRGRLSEGRTWLEGLLATQESSEGRAGGVPACVRAKALNGASVLACMQGDLRRATELATRSLALFRVEDDESGVAAALASLGNAAHAQGNYKPTFRS
ncbi:MAG: hypothetical protein M3Q29_01800 [Chloroflexota bacterium]|nr:hypothetical protein [Chloroflexota bacterium]